MIFDKQLEFRRPEVKQYRRFGWPRFAEGICNAVTQLATGAATLIAIILVIFGGSGAMTLPRTRKEFGMLLVVLLVFGISIALVAHYR
ncbi:hypothetical protein [Collimonas silvisoli]|uniref:hypothetical protein n=1 Tax=Collimonas silvisoli TaxID=2825884 RepID=UPI001B8B436E|nr:hypothetical protein [Collimonas silvisoli]